MAESNFLNPAGTATDMLQRLSIRNVVLIDSLDIEFGAGLCVLTGETGAGKSILLDALGLALGRRAEAALVGAADARAAVSALFELAAGHPALRLLDHQAIANDGTLLLRRELNADGRSRAFINDQPVTVGLLEQVGRALVEILGQNDRLGLLDAASHRGTLDDYGRLDRERAHVAAAHDTLRAAELALATAELALAEASRDRDLIAADLAELDTLAPEPGEDSRLAEERAILAESERIAAGLSAAAAVLAGERATDEALRLAQRHIADANRRARGRLDSLAAALDRALIELTEAMAELDAAGVNLELDPRRLERVEERLFALRAAARKHGLGVDDLAGLRAGLRQRIAALGAGESALAKERAAVDDSRLAFRAAAEALSAGRRRAAAALDVAVGAELAGLRLGRATFVTRLETLPEERWGPEGSERVWFEVQTNPGSPPGPLHRIASGGELSRFMLALRVAMAGVGRAATLVFDEIDAGIGGAVADAVGQRLARLGQDCQVLVVTHQPQVAARAAHHLRVTKRLKRNAATTEIALLDADGRQEEIARMLAGAEITAEARAAAARLLDPRPAIRRA